MAGTGFIGDFKRAFLTGLAALFPILITVFLVTWLYGLIDRTIGVGVNSLCRTVVAGKPAVFETVFPGAPDEAAADYEGRLQYARENFPRFIGVAIGIVGALVAVYLLGLALRSYVGSRIVGVVDRVFTRFPVIKSIYPHARQIADLLFGARGGDRFRRVVFVQYPRRGVYSVGFLTGDGIETVEKQTQKNLATVFVPTSPTPLTGFVILVPNEEVVEIDMSVEEAFRYFMTAGLISPGMPQGGPLGEEAGAQPANEDQEEKESRETPEATSATGEQADG